MELRPHEHYDYVIVLARNTQDWNRLVELLDLQTVRHRGRIGAARGLEASRLIELLERASANQENPQTAPRKREANGNTAHRRTKPKAGG
jgi:3-methyladenine DNA glycosylase Tag